jgi:hypothetical protein
MYFKLGKELPTALCSTTMNGKAALFVMHSSKSELNCQQQTPTVSAVQLGPIRRFIDTDHQGCHNANIIKVKRLGGIVSCIAGSM